MGQAYSGPCAPAGTTYVPAQTSGGQLVMGQPCCSGSVANPATRMCERAYTTGYMAAPSSAVQNQCNSNNGCNGGWIDAGTWAGTCHEGDHRSWERGHYTDSIRGAICVDPNPASLCPTSIGSVTSGQWVGPTGGIVNRSNDPKLQCTYSQITNPFDATTTAAFNGGPTTLGGIGGVQNQWCDIQPYSAMMNGAQPGPGSCKNFYSTQNQLAFQQLLRINRENPPPANAWASDPALFNIVQTFAEGSDVTVSSNALSMIVSYCVVTNPSWPDNDAVRTMINGWSVGVNSNGQLVGQLATHAAQLIGSGTPGGAGYCDATPDSPHCDCVTAVKLGYNGCSGNTTTACTDFNNMRATFTAAKTNSLFVAQITALEQNSMQPQCVCHACTESHQNIASTYLAPTTSAAYQPCCLNVVACFSSIKVGGSLMPGTSIDASCNSSVSTSSAACPPPLQFAGNTVPNPAAASNALSGNNIGQQVGGSTVIQTSPTGTNLGVTTTGTPNGAVTTVTGGPGPSPSDNTQTKYALAAGGGFLGLSFSFACFIIICMFIIVIFMTSQKPGPPPVVPLSVYGL